jgi:hypothetical protein
MFPAPSVEYTISVWTHHRPLSKDAIERTHQVAPSIEDAIERTRTLPPSTEYSDTNSSLDRILVTLLNDHLGGESPEHWLGERKVRRVNPVYAPLTRTNKFETRVWC